MKFLKVAAFTKLNSFDVLGNPANVFLFNEEEALDENLMSKLAYEKFPISVFSRRRKGLENEFDIRYYTKDGKEFGLCGHATICAAGILSEQLEEKSAEKKIILHLKSGETIDVSVVENRVTIKFPTKEVGLLNDAKKQKMLSEIFGISAANVVNFYKSDAMNDYLIFMKDSASLRNVSPNLELLSSYCEPLKSRVITLLAKSDLDEFDFEVRVFSHLIIGKEEGDGEDVVCGSANCSIANLVGQDFYRVLFPYQHKLTGKFGGVQFVKRAEDGASIELTGGYEVLSEDFASLDDGDFICAVDVQQ